MLINADLHIHSRYSGATSDKMTISSLSIEAPRKGINVLATGDCLHTSWQKEIKTCTVIDDGTFEMNGTRFILSTEVEDNHRVHHLLYFPSFSAVDAFKESIKSKSRNIDSDGRPNVNMDGVQLAGLAKDVEALIGPAHGFTPWTALYAYHPSLESCYGDLTGYISFIELGLSADSDYADMIQELHRLTFLTNSDSHSPHPVRLAREFTRFQVQEPTFDEIKKAILRTGGNKPVLNVGLPPQEGKYNESACIACFTHYSLDEAIKRRWKCSCGKRIKKGVRDRIGEIATFKEPRHPTHRPPYVHLIPLSEIIAKALGQHTPFTQSVTKRWDELINAFRSEITVLLDVDLTRISQVTIPAITAAIEAFRNHKVVIIPGGGGKYGTIELPTDDAVIPLSIGPKDSQTSLLDY
ncbi:MAG: phosphotransferase [Thermoplasmata archaeon M11B2D]|nr:MAG: phosphotransferase [Thermoplasmata archaeon M11B2D]PNX53284.1 MAG: phosphotransferase [Thermoplasmata archaeon M9B2D]